MRPTLVCRTSLVLLAALLCTAMALSQVQIASPTNGQTVRGMLSISATKSDPNNGWIAYKIEGPQQSGDFSTAVVSPFSFRWDTNLRDAAGKATYPDGEYTITAVAHEPSGNKSGQDSVRVTLSNELAASEKPSSITLQTNYKRHSELAASAEGSERAKLIEHEDLHQKIIEMFSGSLDARWRERAMSNSAGGSAIVRMFFDKGYHSFTGYKPTNLSGVGDITTLIAQPNASLKLKHKDDSHFNLGELYLELPDRSLREGSTWRSDMYVLPMLRADRRRVTANHRLDGFQWVGPYKCARIISQYSENDVKLKLRMGTSTAPAGGMGMPGGGDPFGMGAMMGAVDQRMDLLNRMSAPNAEDLSWELGGPQPAGPGGPQAATAQGPASAEIKTSYSGVRISYFAYELGQFVRSEDIITHKMTIDSSQFGGGMGGGMMGPGMDAGMMGPGMDPGMMPPMDPGMMPPGAGAMGPGGVPMPGGADMGMPGYGGMQQVEPVKKEFDAESTVKLTIYKRR